MTRKRAKCHTGRPHYKDNQCRPCWESSIKVSVKVRSNPDRGKRIVSSDVPIEERAKIKALYDRARELTRIDGVKRHVDHIIPISLGGVHRLHNLQILTADENICKGNKIETDVDYIGGDVIDTEVSREYYRHNPRPSIVELSKPLKLQE